MTDRSAPTEDLRVCGGTANPPLNLPPGWGETFRAVLRVDSCLRRNDGRVRRNDGGMRRNDGGVRRSDGSGVAAAEGSAVVEGAAAAEGVAGVERAAVGEGAVSVGMS